MTQDAQDTEYMTEMYLVAYLDMIGETWETDYSDPDTALLAWAYKVHNDTPLWRYVNGWSVSNAS